MINYFLSLSGKIKRHWWQMYAGQDCVELLMNVYLVFLYDKENKKKKKIIILCR